jgi:protease-4
MSILSLFNDIFREPWMIDPQTAVAQKQVLQGLLMGMEFEEDDDEDELPDSVKHSDDNTIPNGKRIHLSYLQGTMFRDGTVCGIPGTRVIAADLLEADSQKDIIGHILIIDSGGGAANSVPDLAEAIQACTKPVIAYVDGYMCSAAMYVGSYCDYIIAHREEDQVGCIGTMIQLADFPKQVRDNDGMVHVRVYADGADEKNGEYEAALEGNFELIKERILNPANERFKADIRKNRPAVKDDQLKGRTYNAKEVEGTLIDAVGNFESAVAKILELSNLNITQMKGHENLQSLESCRDLQMVDGFVSLNGEQLAEIENALGQLETEKALNKTHSDTIAEQLTEINELTAERDELKPKAEQLEAKEAEIASLTQERDTLREEAAQKDARIAELEAALEHDPENDEDPLPAMHNGNPAKPEDSWKEPTDEESAAYCRQVLNGEI